MKKIEGYVRDKNDPRQAIYQLDTASQGHFEQPALLLIAEDGEQLPEVPEWIKCSDRLPHTNDRSFDEEVLVLTKWGVRDIANQDWEQGHKPDHWSKDGRRAYEMEDVTHWQPLPKAPHQ